MKKLIQFLYNNEYTGYVKYEDSNDEEEITITVEQSNLFMYTESSEEDNETEKENEEDCHEPNAGSDEPIKIVHLFVLREQI